MLNSVCLMGRLVADPEVRHTPNQVPVCSFRIAVDRTYTAKGQEKQADFINIVAWRSTADFVGKYFRKGQLIAVQGSLQSDSYTDKEGNKRTSYNVVADNVFFAEAKRESGGAPYQPGGSQVPQYQEAPQAFSTAAPGDFEEITGSDDLPF